MTAIARINKSVKAAIPQNKPFRVIWEPTGIGKRQILRVVTPAWKSLPKSERVRKVREAVEPNLTLGERAQIFRFSVLTPAELRRLDQVLPARHRSVSRMSNSNGRPKAAAA